MIKANDKVTYFGEAFTVIEVLGENAFIKNERHGYMVPVNMLVLVEKYEAKPVENKPVPAKKKRK